MIPESMKIALDDKIYQAKKESIIRNVTMAKVKILAEIMRIPESIMNKPLTDYEIDMYYKFITGYTFSEYKKQNK